MQLGIWYPTMAFLSILFLIVGAVAIVWLIIHIERGMRYSRRKAFFSAALAAVMFGFGLHFLMIIFGA